MKKLYQILFLLSIIVKGVIAQNTSFTLSTKDAKGQGPNSNFLIEAKSKFKNISTDPLDTSFEWVIIDVNMPTGWEFGMCDPNNCLTNLSINRKAIFLMENNVEGEFKGDFSPNNISGTGKAKIIITSKKYPQNTDTLQYTVNAWVTSVKEVAKTKEFSVFPNPAKDKLTIKYLVKESILIDIYNVLGLKVKTVIHAGLETDVNLSDLSKGVYFIRFVENGKTTSKQITITD